MKAFLKAALAALFVISGILSASGQEAKDFYKFDDNGFLCEFQLTLPDTTVIRYKHQYNSRGRASKPFVEGDYANITYADGTVVDFSMSAYNAEYRSDKYPGLLAVVPHYEYNDYYILTINDWYKRIRKATNAPKGPDMIKNMFDIREYLITFPDNSQLYVECAPTFENVRIGGYTDCDADGDFTTWDRYGYGVEKIKWQGEDLPFIELATGEEHTESCIVSGTKVRSEENDGYVFCTQKGRIITSGKETFIGTFDVITKREQNGTPLASNYLRAALADYPKKLHGFGDIFAFAYENGNVLDKDNKIVAMYRKSKKLDDFDMESELAAEQGKIDKEKAAAQAAAKEKNALTTKYGKKYADAFLAGKVIVGMPWELVQLGLEAHSFKDFYTALLSVDRSSEYGKTECYSLYSGDFSHIGNMWIRNNAVESITLY